MAVVVEIKHPGQQHARFHREDVPVSAAAYVKKMPDAPCLGRRAVDHAEFSRACAAVNHLVIGNHHNFVGRGEAIDAERVELAPRAAHHAIVNHDEIGVRIDDVARL